MVSHMCSSRVQDSGNTLSSDEVSLRSECASDPDGETYSSELGNGMLRKCSCSACAGFC